ncbi:hypothetical protein D3C73_554000 [compost metagenome]
MVELTDFNRRAPHRATLGGLRVGVGEMTEAGRVFRRFAVHGHCRLRCRMHARGTHQQGHGREQQSRESQSHCQP